MLLLSDINAMDRAAFERALGGVFERSPWVAERAFAKRPFASGAQLHAAMVESVQQAAHTDKLALLNAHPELAGKEATAGTLTASSSSEQASAGLASLSRVEVERIAEFNRAYRAKFCFPFIIAVRDYTRAGIFAEFERRLAQDPQVEFETCLAQVYRITRIRLTAIIAGFAEQEESP